MFQEIVVCGYDDIRADNRLWPPAVISEAKKRRTAKRFLLQCGFTYDMIRNMSEACLVHCCKVQRKTGAKYGHQK